MRSRRVALLALAATGLAGALTIACYKDATSPGGGRPFARVLITDSPFPFDSVASVNIWVDSIDASDALDTTGLGGGWVTVSKPDASVNLLAFQQGQTADLGGSELSAGQYKAVRLVLDANKSSIKWSDGSDATVNWQNWSASGKVTLYAIVESPVAVGSSQTDIVIDFDVGRSFLYDYFGDKSFTLVPWLRAVNKAATGTISGTVTSDYLGSTQPVQNANLTVYPIIADPPYPQTILPPNGGNAVATGHTDAQGKFTIAFLAPGNYIVTAEQPDIPILSATSSGVVDVKVGTTLTVALQLTPGGNGGSPFIQIVGPSSVGVGGSIGLVAAVGDAGGSPLSAAVTWASLDTGIVSLSAAGDSALVNGLRSGTTRIAASATINNVEYADTVFVQVLGAPAPVATVTVTPPTATLSVSDSTYFTATMRDSLGNELSNVPVTWSVSDSTVVQMYPYAQYALVRPKKAGTATLRATSGGKSGSATITIN